MTTKVARLSVEAQDILRRYSDGSLTDCVWAMEGKIKELQEKIPDQTVTKVTSGVSFGVPAMRGGMPAEYWKELKKELDIFVERASRGF
jgi:hypothetical protein